MNIRKSGRRSVVSCRSQITLLALTQTLVIVNPMYAAPGDSWSAFRNGGSSRVSGTLPSEWTPDHNIAWEFETDGYGQSAPIIHDGHVYVCSVMGPMKTECVVTAYDLESGKKRWQIRRPSSLPGPSTYMYSRGAPTPVADKEGVTAFFESGDLVRVTRTGEVAWQMNLGDILGPLETRHGLGCSPAQSGDLIFINLEHQGPSALVAVSKATGDIVWKADRPSGSSWTSPVYAVEVRQVIVSSAGEICGYSADDGTKLWSVDGLEGNSVPSPCIDGEQIFVGARIPEFGSAAEAAKSNLCLTLSGGGGDRADVSWRAAGAVCDYASPVVDGDHVYFLNKVGVLSCLNASTGEQFYRVRLGAECWATPIIADNGIYFFARDGRAKVIARGPDYQALSTSSLWDSEAPPQPEVYKEAQGDSANSHGHAGEQRASTDTASGGTEASHSNTVRSAAGGMVARMMAGDKNGDGFLEEEELSGPFRAMFPRLDKNSDGKVAPEELDAMAKSFAERRANSRSSSRDPIVYGAAAVPGSLIIRTGTRIYCIRDSGVLVGEASR